MKQTIPHHARRWRTVLFLAALCTLVILTMVLSILAGESALFPIDLRITRWLQAQDGLIFAALMRVVSWPGYTPQSYLLVLAAAALLFMLRFRWEAVSSLFAAAMEELLNLAAKTLIHRPRPTSSLVHVFRVLQGYSYPSGHVMFYTCYFGFLFYLVYILFGRSWGRTALLAVLGGEMLLVSVSRVYLGEHWASDAAGAYLLGCLGLIAAVQLYRWGKQRHFIRPPVAKNGGSSR